MKKLKSMLVTLAMLLCSVSVGAHEFEVNGIYYNYADNEKQTVKVTFKGNSATDYNEYRGDIVIPETVTYNNTTYCVTGISSSAFMRCSGLTSVIISNSVTSIEYQAFRECSSLTSVTIGNGVESIASDAFYACNNLRSMIIGIGVTFIGPNQVIPLKTIWLPSTPPNGYSNLRGLVNYVVSEDYGNKSDIILYSNLRSLFEIDGAIFVPVSLSERTCDVIDCKYNETSSNIKIEEYVTYKNINFSVKDIMPYTFYENSYIENVTLNNKGNIGSYGFYNCTNVTAVTLGNNINSISNSIFGGCTNLESISLGDNLQSIGDEAFSNCISISQFKIKASIPPTCGQQALDDIDKWNCTLSIPKGCIKAYQDAEQWNCFFLITENDVEESPDIPTVESCNITLNNNIATYCSKYDLDFTDVAGLKAYIASGYNKTTGRLMMSRVYDVPAGTGLLLKGETGSYEIPVTTSSSSYSNMLKGVTTATIIGPNAYGHDNYILANGTNGIGFYPVGEEGTIAAGKAYLQLPEATSAAKGVSIEFDETTGIKNNFELTTKEFSSTVYDMMGRKVVNLSKGLYIKNGKKVIIK